MFQQIAMFAIPILLAVTLHEAAHGYVALHFGDETAKNAGRITLNPLKHIDPFGTIVLPLLLVLSGTGFIFGYAKPVPVNFSALRNPRWNMIWVAAAGPGMNFLLAAISAILLYTVLTNTANEFLAEMLRGSVGINMLLAFFNMLPLPPLDGSKVIAPFLPAALARPYLAFGRYGMLVLLALFFFEPFLAERTGTNLDIFGTLVQRPADFLTHTLLSAIGSA